MANLQNPVKAIRAKCLDCCCNQINEVKECPVQNCAIWPFRLGKNPYRAKTTMTEEQKQIAVARLRAAREAKKG